MTYSALAWRQILCQGHWYTTCASAVHTADVTHHLATGLVRWAGVVRWGGGGEVRQEW